MAADPGATTALPDDVKKNVKSIVLELRHLFEADLGLGLKRLGIDAETGKVTPADDPALSYLTAEEREARGALDAVLAKEAAMTKDVPEAVRAVLREAAYTHLNRLIGLKCLELRGHLTIDGESTEVVTQRSDYGDMSKYLWTLRSRDARLLGDPELLLREGLLRACMAASAELGVLFDPEDPYAQVWPSYKALVQAVGTLDELPESAFRADELLGWVYQYFQSEEKDRVFAEVKTKKKKIAWSDIVPVTQLYTERYMVDFLLQNCIGARWMEMYPDSRAKEAWPYYVEPATPHTREPQAVKEWTVLDPCCGSGHFLVVAFDLLARLYAEERGLAEQGIVPADWVVPEAQVARTILERNLHGVDIDPRAVQLSALALYLKAKELGLEGTPQMHLVIADCVLQSGQRYQTLLDSYRDDPAATEAIEAIWSALENVRDLGSLVRIEEEVEPAVEKARKRLAGSFDDLEKDWDAYKAELIARLKSAFAAEASSRDERLRVFGAEAEKGLDLFDLLSARYDVVCTNPPYMGSGNMSPTLQRHIERHYTPGKHDLFSAFILRNLELASDRGLVAMVTQQSWMFLGSFRDLRRGSPGSRSRIGERGILGGTTVRAVAHLGSHAFSEVSGEVVSVCLFVLDHTQVAVSKSVAVRLTAEPTPAAKSEALRDALIRRDQDSHYHVFSQSDLRRLPEAPFAYWLPQNLLHLLEGSSDSTIPELFISEGLGTRDEMRFVRYWWEVPSGNGRWLPYAKGGGYRKWCGLDLFVVDWADSGARVKAYITSKYPADKFTLLIRHERMYGQRNLTYSTVASGSLSARDNGSGLFSDAGPGVFVRPRHDPRALAVLNSRLASFLIRALCASGLNAKARYVAQLPVGQVLAEDDVSGQVVELAVDLKRAVTESELVEARFRRVQSPAGSDSREALGEAVAAVLLSVEGLLENEVFAAARLEEQDVNAVLADTGTPAGWHPLIDGYDAFPEVPAGPSGLSWETVTHASQDNRLELSSSAPAPASRWADPSEAAARLGRCRGSAQRG